MLATSAAVPAVPVRPVSGAPVTPVPVASFQPASRPSSFRPSSSRLSSSRPIVGLASGLTVRPVHTASATTVPAVPGRTRRVLARVLPIVAAALALGLLTAELLRSHVSLTDVNWPLVAGALAVTVLAQVVAAVNVRGFCMGRPALGGLVLAQFGVCFARTMAPSALGTATIIGRHLHRRGASPAEVAGALAASQTTQAITTSAIVAGVSIGTGQTRHLPGTGLHLPTTGLLYGGVAIVVLVAAATGAAWRSARARRLLRTFLRAVADVGRDARRHPVQVLGGVAAGVLLTVVHVAAFALIAAATGIHVALPVLLLIYLGAMTAGSIIPTPGGLGAVEAALTAGLVAAGAAAAPAAAAALLARVVTVWMMALPGWFALRHLRRVGLL